MTTKECYDKMGANYDEALGRLTMDKLIEKFMLKYLDDPSMGSLKTAVADGNIEESFKAAHTLKGVAANLAFTSLFVATDKLTEQLRPCTDPADPELYAAVETEYEKVIAAINEYKAQM